MTPVSPGGARRLPRSVIALGFVSLFTDVSSEMIYPLLPAFLVSLGAGATLIGLIEGVAETTSSFLKLVSGAAADRARRKRPLVILGYGLASVARPLVALAQAPWHVLAIRFTDRVGKGIRTSPRDALIAEAVPGDRRGAAFGFHRAMDHAGALLGPLVAYALLAGLGFGHRAVFALAAIPALAAMAVLVLGVRETERPPAPDPAPSADPGAPTDPRRESRPGLPRELKVYLGIVGLFTLASSSDAFLLLRAIDVGVPAAHGALLWALLHAIKAGLSAPLGALSDRRGRRTVIVAGWLVYAATYAGFAAASAPWHAWALFALYGAFFALVEGAEKALVADLAPPDARGRAFGAFHFVVGTCALPASVGFGLVWQRFAPAAAFAAGAALAAAAAGLLATARDVPDSPDR